MSEHTLRIRFQAMFCVMFGVMGAGMGAIFIQDAKKAKLASADVFMVAGARALAVTTEYTSPGEARKEEANHSLFL